MSDFPSQPIIAAPHVPAAFINAIAEEGTKGEAIHYLQKQWNENCALRARIEGLEKAIRSFVEAYKLQDCDNLANELARAYSAADAVLNPTGAA